MNGPHRLQRLDLFTDNDKELATLDGLRRRYQCLSSGKKVAYYIDKEVLEIRDLAALNRVARVRIRPRHFHWSARRIPRFSERAIEKKSGDLVWIELPPLAAAPAHEVPVSEPTPSRPSRLPLP